MSKTSVMLYSALGHAYFHMFTAFYFTIVLSLEVEWRRPYHELLELWTPGALLVGAFAIVAGWLGDRWSARGMLVIYFLGMGASSIAAGFAEQPLSLLLALMGIGLFAAIYHPIGIPMVIRNSDTHRGKALAINGLFGSLGAALAGVVSGLLASVGGSFLAFVLPGVVVMATGVAMLIGLRGRAPRTSALPARQATPDRNAKPSGAKPVLILLFCLTVAGLIYHAMQTAMPKVLSVRLEPNAIADLKTVGFYVALIYGIGGLFQFVGGALADRCNLKSVYRYHFVVLIFLLAAATYFGELYLVAVLCAVAAFEASALPAENMLLARYTPSQHYGLVFGLKFVLFFISGPVGVILVSAVHRQTGQLNGLFLLLAVTAALVCVAALLLPRVPPPVAVDAKALHTPTPAA